MGADSEDAVKQLSLLMEQVEAPLKRSFQRPIVPVDLYRSIRDSQLIGLSGYTKELTGHCLVIMVCRIIVIAIFFFLCSNIFFLCFCHWQGLPIFGIGVGHSTYDKASVHYYVQSHIQINEYRDRIILPRLTQQFGRPVTSCIKVLDMTGLKLSALSQIKVLDDLNYPEKTETYYVVNVPYIFSACWKVVKPLLQERTKKKVKVLTGCGRDELLKIMDYSSLPHFCRREASGSSKHSSTDVDNCFSLDHPFHKELYGHIREQASRRELIKMGSLHVSIPEPDPDDAKIVEVIQAEFQKIGEQDESTNSHKD
ncbi:Sec14p-like phosphatidylinositol transfer family protein [Zea mays]|uniref:Sec14p-like phosphatidylinositol transfer family protein n=1 Tax=Zea mays TaxID=4577 RepID=A0A1D6QR68_MAIZE|nr:Sec14p-like phosphatidylinositol transfer family protein [Zea mays]